MADPVGFEIIPDPNNPSQTITVPIFTHENDAAGEVPEDSHCELLRLRNQYTKIGVGDTGQFTVGAAYKMEGGIWMALLLLAVFTLIKVLPIIIIGILVICALLIVKDIFTRPDPVTTTEDLDGDGKPDIAFHTAPNGETVACTMDREGNEVDCKKISGAWVNPISGLIWGGVALAGIAIGGFTAYKIITRKKER